jgi:FkbM family methyltransferase
MIPRDVAPDPSPILRHLPAPLRKPLRDAKLRALCIKDRLAYWVRCFLGTDVWFHADCGYRVEKLGSGDGQWCICPDWLPPKPVVYSFGVGFDISFDLDMMRKYDATVYAFDPTPRSQAWLEDQALPDEFHFSPIGIAAFDGTMQLTLPENHGVSFTSIPQKASQETAICEVRRLETLLKEAKHCHVDILKIDIEGGEYDLIPDLLAHKEKFSQILIEFHHRMIGTPKGLEMTKTAVEKLRSAGFCLFHISARGLEYSFLRKSSRYEAHVQRQTTH